MAGGVRRAPGRERGAAAVEFALVVPLLLVLVFGIISYGYMLSFRQAISQGAAEGARSGAVWASAYDASQDGARISAAKASVDEALTSYGVKCAPSEATCTVTIVPCGTARCVKVVVTYPYGTKPLTPKIPLVPLPSTLTFTSTARVS
jgi:Flp pilus assembly protein TadG